MKDNYYLAEQTTGQVVQINADGSLKQNIVSIPLATGIIGNSGNGHLYVTGFDSTANQNAIFDVNPVTKSLTLFKNISGLPDGIALSRDGKTLYVANNTLGGEVYGFDTDTHIQTFQSGTLLLNDRPDGIALGDGTLAGNIFVNTNLGNLIEINLATKLPTTIFSGGSRGDFVNVDNNGSLLITQSDSVLRLTAPPGGSFIASTPIPAAIWLFGSALAGWIVVIRRKPVQHGLDFSVQTI
ncbi:MAG: SMP-30/gluconolactonase/LRE family protein [Methylobacter sp.]|nr:SMP-30/gluconolactonase/LRE family protein [Methylobacter sp.]